MEPVTREKLEQFLQKLGERLDKPASFYLMGGSALILLGSSRETIDVDYTVETASGDFEDILTRLSTELHLDLERVPLEKFIPLQDEAAHRHHFIGRFGKMDAYVFDPYSIALSKLDRGFEADIDDIVFLVRSGLISMVKLEEVMREALPHAREFDMNAADMPKHLQAVREALK